MKRTSSGQWLSTPKGQKTPKMIEVEQRLGRSLEEDFREYYVEKGWGQIKIANRWGVPRNIIFYPNERAGSRSWVEMLDLPVRPPEEGLKQPIPRPASKLSCEICGEFQVDCDDAHWISHQDGGHKQSFNILRLCPNCHRKLDTGDARVTEQAKGTLLLRETKRIIEAAQDSDAKQKELIQVCEAIITRKTR